MLYTTLSSFKVKQALKLRTVTFYSILPEIALGILGMVVKTSNLSRIWTIGVIS